MSEAAPPAPAEGAEASQPEPSLVGGVVQSVTPEADAGLRDGFWRWGRVLFIVATIYLAVQLLSMAGGVVSAVFSVFLYVVFGGIIALIVAPIANLLARRIPRGVSAFLALLFAVAVLAALIYLVGSPIVEQTGALTSAIPKLQAPFISLQHTLAQHGINVSFGAVANVLGIHVTSNSTGTVLVTAASVTVRLGIDLLITLIAAFWLLADGTRLRRGLLSLLPGRWRTETDFVINAFSTVFGGYLRAQLLLAGLVGGLAGLGCWLLGVPFPLVIGVGAGIFELIPLAGPFVGAAIGALFALTVSPTLTLETLGLFLVIHIIEGYLVSPRIQGHFVRLHPLVSLLALLAGIGAGGFFGAFFAVPLASLVAVIARAGIADLRATQPDLFTISDEAVAARGRRRNLLAQYRVDPRGFLRRVTGRTRARGTESPDPTNSTS